MIGGVNYFGGWVFVRYRLVFAHFLYMVTVYDNSAFIYNPALTIHCDYQAILKNFHKFTDFILGGGHELAYLFDSGIKASYKNTEVQLSRKIKMVDLLITRDNKPFGALQNPATFSPKVYETMSKFL